MAIGAKVLGIAQDGGHPHPGCKEICCQEAWADTDRGHLVACLGVTTDEGVWLVDATPDLPRQLHTLTEGHSLPFQGILLTHAHWGHVGGLGWLGEEALAAEGLSCLAPRGVVEALESTDPFKRLVKEGRLVPVPLLEKESVQLGEGVQATPYSVPHRAHGGTICFRIEGESGSLLWAPDADSFSGWETPLIELVEGVDRAYLDGTFWNRDDLPRRSIEVPHPFVGESIQEMKRWGPSQREKVRFVHLNHTNPLLKPNTPQRRALERAGFSVAKEGESFAL